MAVRPRQNKTWQQILSAADLPADGWIQELVKDPAAMARIVEASKIGLVTIAARWDRGNAWDIWEQMYSGWSHSENGMHSQMPVPIFLSAERVWQKDDGSWGEAASPAEQIGEHSFWNWDA